MERKILKTKSPDDFTVTDQVREWALEKYGYFNLPDMFLNDFIQNWRDRLEDGRPPKWKSPELALKRWIREQSPGGSFHNTNIWESALNRCKSDLNKQKAVVPIPKMKTTPKKVDPEIARQELRIMIKGLGL